jgi:hypothetical protein
MDQLATTGTDVARLADTFRQWYLANGKAGPVLPKATFAESPARSFNLKGSVPRKFLRHEKSTGVNLGWTDDASPTTAERVSRWFVDRPGTATDPIRYGEPIALGYGIAPSFLRYSHQTIGINLDWSAAPVFEWILLGGPHDEAVNSRDAVAIYNTRAESGGQRGTFLVHFNRELGADIGWPDSRTWRKQITDLGLKIAGERARALVLAEFGITV